MARIRKLHPGPRLQSTSVSLETSRLDVSSSRECHGCMHQLRSSLLIADVVSMFSCMSSASALLKYPGHAVPEAAQCMRYRPCGLPILDGRQIKQGHLKMF